MAAIIRVNSCPAAPTKGRPCWSSWNPGASPTNTSRAGLIAFAEHDPVAPGGQRTAPAVAQVGPNALQGLALRQAAAAVPVRHGPERFGAAIEAAQPEGCQVRRLRLSSVSRPAARAAGESGWLDFKDMGDGVAMA